MKNEKKEMWGLSRGREGKRIKNGQLKEEREGNGKRERNSGMAQIAENNCLK